MVTGQKSVSSPMGKVCLLEQASLTGLYFVSAVNYSYEGE